MVSHSSSWSECVSIGESTLNLNLHEILFAQSLAQVLFAESLYFIFSPVFLAEVNAIGTFCQCLLILP